MAKRSLGCGVNVPDGVELRPIQSIGGGKYVAGSDGHIYCHSTARVNSRKPQPFRLLETDGSAGYPFVAIIENGRRRTTPVHRLICEAFHGAKPSDKSVVRHIDGSRTNNLPENLAWGSYAQNEADKRRHGRIASGEKHGQVKLSEEAVRIIRASIPFGLWNAVDAAKVFGVAPSTIRRVAAGKRDWRGVN